MDADTETLICICCGHDFEASKPVLPCEWHTPMCPKCNADGDDFILEDDDEEY